MAIDSRHAGNGDRPAATWIAAAVLLTAVGAILRGLGAGGELWLDEVWTLNQLDLVTDVFQILVDLSNDNNHIVNSLHMYAVGGAQASPLLLRALSIALGAASVVAAGAAMSPRGRPAAAIAMLIAAVAYPLVHYGSEARGYAGLVLFALIAIACLVRQLDGGGAKSRAGLGAAIGLGLMSHPNMALVATVLGLWTLWVIWRRCRNLFETIARCLVIFAPALVWTAVAATFYGIGWLRHGYDFSRFPFDPAKFVEGYGGLLGLMIGVPPEVPSAIVLVVVAAGVVAVAWHRRDQGDPLSSLYVGVLLILPTLMFITWIPNPVFARHFLFSGLVFLVIVADLLATLWRRGGVARATAAALLATVVAGHAVSLSRFYVSGRGHYGDAVAAMALDGAFSYGSDHDFRNRMMVDFFTRTSAAKPTLVPAAQYCRQPPTWWLTQDASKTAPERLSLGGTDCSIAFVRARTFPVWGLSGPSLALYRRSP
jgi:hypothetical protein